MGVLLLARRNRQRIRLPRMQRRIFGPRAGRVRGASRRPPCSVVEGGTDGLGQFATALWTVQPVEIGQVSRAEPDGPAARGGWVGFSRLVACSASCAVELFRSMRSNALGRPHRRVQPHAAVARRSSTEAAKRYSRGQVRHSSFSRGARSAATPLIWRVFVRCREPFLSCRRPFGTPLWRHACG